MGHAHAETTAEHTAKRRLDGSDAPGVVAADTHHEGHGSDLHPIGRLADRPSTARPRTRHEPDPLSRLAPAAESSAPADVFRTPMATAPRPVVRRSGPEKSSPAPIGSGIDKGT